MMPLEIISENEIRIKSFRSTYNPMTGEGSPIKRTKIYYKSQNGEFEGYFPDTMFKDPVIKLLAEVQSIETLLAKTGQTPSTKTVHAIEKHIFEERLSHDFEFWAVLCVLIQHKISKASVPLILNRPQRKLLLTLETMRVAESPIRVILLKARQWGGSTLVQAYMAWMQIRIRKNWHSAIVADVEDQARNIRDMLHRIMKEYPKDVATLTWAPFAGSNKTKIIRQRNCIVGVGSAQKPESLRSYDFAMLHLSEVGLWKDTVQKKAADLAQTLQATVPDTKDTLIVLESTAKGVGNYFHRQWINAEKRQGIFKPIFIPWFDVEMYQKPIEINIKDFIQNLTDYEKLLWNLGATLEGINWYTSTKKGYDYDDWRMKSEYPSTAEEAFQSSGNRVFPQSSVHRARENCIAPIFYGDVFPKIKGRASLENPKFEEIPKGNLFIWAMPDTTVNVENRYCIFVDVGGRTETADKSVIKVLDRYWMADGGTPEVVAVWEGNIDQDLLAWKAAQIGTLYQNAQIAIETNSLKSRDNTEGSHYLTILDEIAEYYDNLYTREAHDKLRQGRPTYYGFHTNQATKTMIINTLNSAIRDTLYIERDERACFEMDTYEHKADGTMGSIDGTHDDHVIATAGAIWLAYHMPLPIEKKRTRDTHANIIAKRNRALNEASF